MRIFLQLVREKNASKVANDAGLSQQAVSGYIKKLREEFPHELFLRESNGLQPTDFAYDLARKMERVLEEFDGIFHDNQFVPLNIKRTIRIIANEYGQLAIIPKLFSRALLEAPGLKIEVLDFDVKSHFDLVASGSVDLIIGFGAHIDHNLIQRRVTEDRYSCVVGNDSKIAKKIKSIDDLSLYPHVDFANGETQFGGTVDEFLAEKKVSRNVIATLSCYTSLNAFLSSNDVIAFIPAKIASSGQFRMLDFGIFPVGFSVMAAWHRRADENPIRKWLVALADNAARFH